MTRHYWGEFAGWNTVVAQFQATSHHLSPISEPIWRRWSARVVGCGSFLVDGKVTDRALQDAIRMSGWTAEELRFGLNKSYAVDLAGVSRFLYSQAGKAFLDDQTRSYVPY